MTLWAVAGRLALLGIVWASLVPVRGARCVRTWWLAVEGLVVVAGAWFAGDGIAAGLCQGRQDLAPCGWGRLLARVSFAVAGTLILAWGLAGVAACRGRPSGAEPLAGREPKPTVGIWQLTGLAAEEIGGIVRHAACRQRRPSPSEGRLRWARFWPWSRSGRCRCERPRLAHPRGGRSLAIRVMQAFADALNRGVPMVNVGETAFGFRDFDERERPLKLVRPVLRTLRRAGSTYSRS